MSSSKASSSATREMKRRSGKSKKLKFETHYHDVYIVKFITSREGSDYHRALLVEHSREPGRLTGDIISRGEIFEVRGPVRVQLSSICKFVSNTEQNRAPENSDRFVGPKLKLGRIASNRTDDLFLTCESVNTPRGPLNCNGHPDCNDWLNNVIFRLKKEQEVIEFDPLMSSPREEVSMVWMTGTT